jgi:beta-1,4-mannosyl-glycoprotein beta-1,4-N-acetylglucosaminyltransferase
MAKVIDAFLFFKELDLLEIRLAYLDSAVDIFLIVESCQTFSGNPKEFVFEKNLKRFERYKNKIYYHKITDFHTNFNSVCQHLEKSSNVSDLKILNILKGHSHYPKNQLNWVLDTYHRECIHLALDTIANDSDVVILSDLDEIPSFELIKSHINFVNLATPKVCKQKEFRYFLNYFKDSNWLGSIIGPYKILKNYSFNTLRVDSKKTRKIIDPNPIENGGYHFTSCGGIEMIKDKIRSWSHQEFNNMIVLNNLEKNIKAGRDIFHRKSEPNLLLVSFFDIKFFDKKISQLLINYPNLTSESDIDCSKQMFVNVFLQGLMVKIFKFKFKLVSFLRTLKY